MLAVVKDGQVQRTFVERSVVIDGVFYTDVYLLSDQEQKELGIYHVRSVQVDTPDGFRHYGSTYEFQCGEVLDLPVFCAIEES